MAHNMEPDSFIKHVAYCLSREFEKEFSVEEIKEDEYEISLNSKYRVRMTKDYIRENQIGYKLDRLILEAFREQGFEYDMNRSMYIQYCFRIYKDMYK